MEPFVWMFLMITYLPGNNIGVTPYGPFKSLFDCKHAQVEVFQVQGGLPEGELLHTTPCFQKPNKEKRI